MKYMTIPTDIEVEARNPETGRYAKVQLLRVVATETFSDVKAGTLGGLIQDESNLSQEGDCWIYDEAMVYDGAVVEGNAQVRNSAIVRDNSKVDGEAQVLDSAIIEKDSDVTDNAKVCYKAKVTDYSFIKDNAKVYGKAEIRNHSVIKDNAEVLDTVKIDNSTIEDNAHINGGRVIEYSTVKDNSVITNSYISISKINDDTIIYNSTCKTLITKGKVFMSDSDINTPTEEDLTTLENVNIIKSDIRSSKIIGSDIYKSSVRKSMGIIDSIVKNSDVNHAFIKDGIIKKETDYINYYRFGSSELNITFYRRKGRVISASVNDEALLIERFLPYIKKKFSERVLTEVTQLLNAICIEGRCSEEGTLIYSIAHR